MSSIYSRRTFFKTCFVGIASVAHCINIAHAATEFKGVVGIDLIRKLRFQIGFRNPFVRNLAIQKFWCYLPLNSDVQKVHDLRVSMPYQIKTDKLGHQILELRFNEVPGYFQKSVRLEVDVRFTQNLSPLVGADDPIWLKSERYIEAASTPIFVLAKQLQRTSEHETIEAIYKWVLENIEYAGFIADDLGALYALENKKGDCTEYAYLVAALARSNQIPARVIGGYVADYDFAPKPQDYHNWTEVFLDGRWRIVDAQKGRFFPSPSQYLAFRIHHQLPINDIGTAHRYRADGQLQVAF